MVTGAALATAWYRFRTTLRLRWGSYVGVVLLVGLVGGIAMASIAGARRTESAFPTHLTDSEASQLQAQIWNLQESLSGPAQANLTAELARLPNVKHVASAPTVLLLPLGPNGKPNSTFQVVANNKEDTVGSVGGMYFRQDRVILAQGRMADPNRGDEMVATAQAAQLLRWHVGETISLGAYTPAHIQDPSFNPEVSAPDARVSVKLVGLVVFSNQVAEDDVDRYPTLVLITPALTRRLQAYGTLPVYGFRLDHGSRDVASVEREIIHLLPRGTVYAFHVTSVVTGQVQRAIKPEAIALGVFGAIAGLATLLIAGLSISRGLWANGEDVKILRSLGAGPAATTLDAALGLFGAVVLGSLEAIGLAVLLSPLTPIGPVRQLDPSPGFAFDGTVIGTGFAVLVVGLGAFTVVAAYRLGTRLTGRRSEPLERPSFVVGAAERSGMSVPAVAGLRFSLERGRGRTAVPVRSVMAGAVLAVLVLVATVTFSSGLSTLNSHPALYGWNWSDAIETGAGGSVPPIASRMLDHDHDVAAWTGFNFGDVQVDGQTVPELDGAPHAALTPPLLSGHALDRSNQIVVGQATLAALHKKVGDTVYLSYGSPQNAPVYVPPTPVVVVGTATFPTVGTSGTLHPSMGTGVLFSSDFGSAAFKAAISSPDPNLNGPGIIVVRFRAGVSPAAGLASLQHISDEANRVLNADPNSGGSNTFVVGAQRPAEIVSYQSTGATPSLLAASVVAGAVVALGLTLVSSVRRRRRDLALMKTLGFTQRQLAKTVAWQASVTAIIGVVVGVPLGIALGRWLWILFARAIYAVPEPSIPGAEITLIVLGALVVANVVAALPGRIAARTPTGLVLRSE